jgi:hypothetical protein
VTGFVAAPAPRSASRVGIAIRLSESTVINRRGFRRL